MIWSTSPDVCSSLRDVWSSLGVARKSVIKSGTGNLGKLSVGSGQRSNVDDFIAINLVSGSCADRLVPKKNLANLKLDEIGKFLSRTFGLL